MQQHLLSPKEFDQAFKANEPFHENMRRCADAAACLIIKGYEANAVLNAFSTTLGMETQDDRSKSYVAALASACLREINVITSKRTYHHKNLEKCDWKRLLALANCRLEAIKRLEDGTNKGLFGYWYGKNWKNTAENTAVPSFDVRMGISSDDYDLIALAADLACFCSETGPSIDVVFPLVAGIGFANREKKQIGRLVGARVKVVNSKHPPWQDTERRITLSPLSTFGFTNDTNSRIELNDDSTVFGALEHMGFDTSQMYLMVELSEVVAAKCPEEVHPRFPCIEGKSLGLALALAAWAAINDVFLRPAVITGELRSDGSIGEVDGLNAKYEAFVKLREILAPEIKNDFRFYCPDRRPLGERGAICISNLSMVINPKSASALMTTLLVDGFDDYLRILSTCAISWADRPFQGQFDGDPVLADDEDGGEAFTENEWNFLAEKCSELFPDRGNSALDDEQIVIPVPYNSNPEQAVRLLLHNVAAHQATRPSFGTNRMIAVPFPLHIGTANVDLPLDWRRHLEFGRQWLNLSLEDLQAGLPGQGIVSERLLLETAVHFPSRLVLLAFSHRSELLHSGATGFEKIESARLKLLHECAEIGMRVILVASDLHYANFCVAEWAKFDKLSNGVTKGRSRLTRQRGV